MEIEKEVLNEKKIERLKEKSREYSVKDGMFSTVKTSIVDNYMTPFAIAINSPNYFIGLLSSIPGILGPFTQLHSSKLIGKIKRKKIVLTSVFFEILSWIPLSIIAILYYYNYMANILPLMLLIFFSYYVITSNAGTSAWFSWIGDLVDEKYRGRWFSKRHAIFSFVSLSTSLLSALLLDFLKKHDLTMLGFIILFVIAFFSRIISRYYLSKKYEPKIKIRKEEYFNFFDFIKKAPYNNFGRFAIFRALLNMTVAIAGPYFTVYMLETLNFSYLQLILVHMSAVFYTIIIVRYWGKFSDKYGNYEVLKITTVIIAIIPLTWLINDNIWFLILVPQLISGIGWGGFNLAASNYVFDCVTPQKRGLVFSYYELLNGIGVFIGAGIGSLMVAYLDISFMHVFLFLFLVSSIGRIIVSITMLKKIKEVKNKKKFKTSSFIKSIIVKARRHNDKEHREY
ncbi:MAG: MFS transporter [Nanoarchaeota archaeon]|nr:MFS transporter [Nanoarchaeota archaeon]